MKTKILSRMLLSVAIVAISVMMTAASCKKADVLAIAKALKVASKDATNVSVETDAKTGVTTVSIVHAEDKGLPKKKTDAAPDFTMDFAGVVDGYLMNKTYDHAKEVFTVEIPLATSGIVVSKMHSGEKAEKMEDVATGKILMKSDVAKEDFKPENGFAFMPNYEADKLAEDAPSYAKTLQFMTALVNDASFFVPNTTVIKDTTPDLKNITGLFCRADAGKIALEDLTNAALVAKETLGGDKADAIKADTFKDKTFEGAQKASCYTVRNAKEDVTAWATTAPKDSVRERTLLFIGVETGKATIGDVAKAVPKVFASKDDVTKGDGFSKTTFEELAKQYPITKVANVVIKMVEKIGAKDGGEKDDE